MVIMSLNNNQMQSIADRSRVLNNENYFNTQIRKDELDHRVVTVRFYKFGEPGWVEYSYDHNGSEFGPQHGGLD